MEETQTERADPPTCSHYRRGCCVLAECCKKWVGCRLCHAEQFPDHEIDRHAIRQMQCLSCQTIQPCARECSKCNAVMGDYFCGVCNLFDNEGATKKIFHCDDCGICRVGGRENYYHCATCCGCYPHSLSNKHRCVQGSMHRECAICLEVTFSSLEGTIVMRCGHVLHNSCWKTYVRYGHFTCPTCRESMLPPRPPRVATEPQGDGEQGDAQAPGDADQGDEADGDGNESLVDDDSDGSESLVEEVDEFSDSSDAEDAASDAEEQDRAEAGAQ